MTSTIEARADMPRDLAAKLERISKAREAKRLEQERQLAESGYSPESVAGLTSEAATMQVEVTASKSIVNKRMAARPGRGVSAVRLIEKAQLALFEGEERGLYQQFPIDPGSEYPSILTRVPVFLPGKRTKLAECLDADGAIPFKTSWGTGRKVGPPLSIYDEDTLIAIMGLRQKQLVGAGNNMPIEVMTPGAPGGEISVQVLFTTVSEIQEFLELKSGGCDFEMRLASVKRLNLVQIEFTHVSDPSLNSVIKKGTHSTKLIELLTQETTGDACLYIQIPPLMVQWLTKSYTYIDPKIRRALTDNGKAIHRFLASQPRFNFKAETLREVTGTMMDYKNFMRALRETMKRLAELGWCEFEIEGNGRSVPHKLVGRRLKGKLEQGVETGAQASV